MYWRNLYRTSLRTAGASHAEEEVYTWRMVTLELHAPTRGGDQQIVLFSNLPSQVSGLAICEAAIANAGPLKTTSSD
ncbi:MAG: hypothetical protein U0894_09050 [Pirellulales bacterium]